MIQFSFHFPSNGGGEKQSEVQGQGKTVFIYCTRGCRDVLLFPIDFPRRMANWTEWKVFQQPGQWDIEAD